MPSARIWTTESVNQSLEKLRLAIPTDMSCFHENDIELKAANILFKLSETEVEEFTKCSSDIIYFVEKYCRFLTDKGRITVPLRKYQKKILKALAMETYSNIAEDLIPVVRNLIMLQSRQSGKCLLSGDITVMFPDKNVYKIPISIFYYMILSKERKLTLLEKVKVKLLITYHKL